MIDSTRNKTDENLENSDDESNDDQEKDSCECNNFSIHKIFLRDETNFENHGVHYGKCIYCIMNRDVNHEEYWDSWEKFQKEQENW